jgi:hypothetical protein
MEHKEEISSLIPQKPPFVMVGELLHSDELVTRTGFRVPAENIFTINSRFAEAGLLENLEIFALPGTNDELITEIKVVDKVLNVSVISGKVWCNDQLVAQCEMKVFMEGEDHGQ